jgi:phosphate-selective porin OprO/OprP
MHAQRIRLLAAATLLASSTLQAGESSEAESSEAAAVTASAGSSAEEPAKKDPRSNPTYIEGRGFDFRTSDGLFDFSIGANLQVRFSNLDADGPGSATEFRVRRFKLYMAGFLFDPRLTYRFQLAFENFNNARLLDDAWMAWKFTDLLQVQAGQSKTPYGRQELMNDGILMFAERSIATDAFKPNRDTGVMLLGFSKGSVLQYAAGVFGGAGQTTLRGTNHVMPIARVVWSTFGDPRVGEADLARSPKPRISIGANGFYNTLRKSTPTAFESTFPSYASATGWLGQNVALFETGEDVEVGSGGVDFQAAWCGISLQGEFFFGHARGVSSGVNLNSRGYYIELGAMVLPRLGLAARYSNVDSNRSVTRDQQSEVNGTATWYFRKNNAKMLLEYSNLHRQRSGQPANDRFLRIQVQLFL